MDRHALRVPLPLLVPRRGRGDRARARHRRGAAGLQPRRRAAAGRADDRQGDQGGAPAPAPGAPDRRALLQGLSGLFSMLLAKVGGVPAHPANVHRLLLRRGAARARLPRGPQGDREALQGPLPAAPLRPRRLRRGGDAREAPIVPVAVVGAEEAMPIFAHVGLAAAAHRPASTSRSRPASPGSAWPPASAYLPAKFRIRFLEPDPDRPVGRRAVERPGPRADRGRGHPRPDPGGALDMLASAAGPCGSDDSASSSPGSPPTGAAGSPRCSSATTTSRRSSASRPTTRRSSCERTEFVRVGTQHALLRRIVQAAEIDTVVDTRLVVDRPRAARARPTSRTSSGR